MDLNGLVDRSFGLLGEVLNESIPLTTGGDLRCAFVYRHATNILRLGQDVIYLLTESRVDSCQIVVRATLESLFKLVAATKRSEAAHEIVLSEVEEQLGRISKWLDPVACAPAIDSLSKFAKQLRKDFGISSNRKWSVIDCADAAELTQNYREDYFCFSGSVHATTSGIISQESRVGAGYALQTLLFVVLCAVAHFVQVVQTGAPQKSIDEAAMLLRELTRMVDEGIFRELDREEE